jgi:hypothetical protein
MIRNFWPFCVLATVFAWAQANSEHPAAPASTISPDTPVITIKGLCSQPGVSAASGPDSACTTVVTRAQFERLVTVLKAEKDPQSRQQLSTAYPQILVLAHEAEARGLDKQPGVQERLNFARLQILSRELVGQIREEAAHVPDKDIEDYYRQNPGQFEQVSLERIIIPIRAQPKPDAQGATGNLDETAMTKLAESLRARAAAGEDFTKLQKQAYEAAGLSGNTEPNPHMDKLRRRGLPLAHASVFDMKPGEVSPVISDATGHYIYKLESKEAESLEAVKSEISNTLHRQRFEKMVHQVEEPFKADVNHAYFGAEVKAPDD